MSEKPPASLQTILHPLEMVVPKSTVHRVKELYPAVMESIVSVLCAENKIYLSTCIYMAVDTKCHDSLR
jgi:hypothetical protein